jgi:CheY-like chemotaxis protein
MNRTSKESVGRARRVASPHLILLVEDNPADADLIQESFAEGTGRVKVDVAVHGEAAIDYLSRKNSAGGAVPFPQLILLDLNLPRLDGRQVLSEIKASCDLRHIPVVVLSSSTAESDVMQSYELGASCYLVKPYDLDSFRRMVRALEDFWLAVAELPPRRGTSRADTKKLT